jgi:hypothetical protein
MSRSYLCPQCNGLLNPGTKVIFVIEQGGDRGLVLLSPKLGDYAMVLGAAFPLTAGVAYLFRCPICHADLTSPVDGNLVEILSRGAGGTVSRLDFSRIAGEHATFLRGPDGIERFGEHVGRYDDVNFFGAGQGQRN